MPLGKQAIDISLLPVANVTAVSTLPVISVKITVEPIVFSSTVMLTVLVAGFGKRENWGLEIACSEIPETTIELEVAEQALASVMTTV